MLTCPEEETAICCCSQVPVVKALRAVISLNGPNQPHLGPLPTPLAQELYLGPALGLHTLFEL